LLAPFLQDGINLLPKIRKQSGGVPIGIKANSLPGMVAVVMLDASCGFLHPGSEFESPSEHTLISFARVSTSL
jgi:hypothetical protein